MKLKQAIQLGLSVVFAMALVVQAQPVIAPQTPPVSLTPPAIEALGPGAMQVFPPGSMMAELLDELQPLQWGPVTLRPHVNYTFTYATGVQSATNQQNDSIIQSLAPGILFVLSRHWTLDYTPTITFYSDQNLKNNVGHAVTLTGGTAYEDWIFGFSQGFSYTDSPQTETGAQTSQHNFSTSLNAGYQINTRLSTDLSINQNLNFPSDYQTTREWSTMDWLNYQAWPQLSFGVGAGFSYSDATPNSTSEELRGRVNWRATDKLSMGINAGGEFTQFTEGDASSLVNPVYSASIQYLPWEQTQISLNASRAVGTSYFDNQVTETVNTSAGLSQRLFQKFYWSAGAGYNWTTYVSAANNAAANSSTEYFTFNTQLSTSVYKRGSVSVFYNYSENLTDEPGLGYTSTQVGFNLGYAF